MVAGSGRARPRKRGPSPSAAPRKPSPSRALPRSESDWYEGKPGRPPKWALAHRQEPVVLTAQQAAILDAALIVCRQVQARFYRAREVGSVFLNLKGELERYQRAGFGVEPAEEDGDDEA